MIDNFINIQVDREARPDLDTIYMNAVMMMNGHGGWPMTVFLTPDGVPFYGGTYYPPVDRGGMPGFPRILISIAEAYKAKRKEIAESAESILGELKRMETVKPAEGDLSHEITDHAANNLLRMLDPVQGGFGRAPKFPPSMTLSFLLRQYARTKAPATLEAVELTLQKMANGGMYDQLGGGFHRYSVDEKWLVPHFEKMLYDNALLTRIYLDAFLVTGNEFYKRIATETLDYVRREMLDSSGGFYSSQDADSEGEEGKFFVWSPVEIEALIGEKDAKLFCRYFDVTERGNFEDHNILHVDVEAESVARLLRVSVEELNAALARGKQILFAAREMRIKPFRDEKMLTAWNGLMLRSFAEAARVLGRADYLEVATKNADFLLREMKQNGRLLRTHKDGESKLNAYLEDYAYLADGLLALYEATFDLRWFEEAQTWVGTMIEQFADEAEGGFFFTSADHEKLIARTKDWYDNATPGGNSVAAHVLLKFALLTGNESYRQKAEQILKMLKPAMMRSPSAFGHLLCALDFYLSSPYEIALVGSTDSPDTHLLVESIFKRYLPNKVIALAYPTESRASETIKLLEGRSQIEGQATAYVCRNFYCEAPVTDHQQLEDQLNR